MNPEPTDRRDADALDDFWDELVLGQFTGHDPRHHPSPNEELVMTLHARFRLDDGRAEARLRQLVFGTTPEPISTIGSGAPLPRVRPEPIRPTWSIRKYSQLAAAALAVVLVGALVATLGRGFINNRDGNEGPTVIPAAVSRLDITPNALASPIAANNGILWTLPFEGTNVEIGASALANDTLYQLIHSDQFTGVQAVDTATGAEKWRSAQEWTGSSLAANASNIVLLTDAGIVGLDPASGEEHWTTQPLAMVPVSLVQGENIVYAWDGNSIMTALQSDSGSIVWSTDAGLPLPTGASLATQAPVVTANGIAAMSATNMVTFFDLAGNSTGSIGEFETNSVELAATGDDTVAIAGAFPQDGSSDTQPWARKLIMADPATASIVWQTDYNALVTGLTVTDTMTFLLADNPGMATTANYPDQTSPNIYGYFLDTGESVHMPEDTPPPGWVGRAWVSDAGTPPFVALAQGAGGPIAISESGRLTFFGPENPLVRAVVDLPGALPNQISADDTAVYVPLANGSITAVAPVFAAQEPQELSRPPNIDWSMPATGSLVDFGGMAYSNGLVYRLIDTGSGPLIETTYAATGQPAWTLPFDWSTDQIVADLDSTNSHPNQAHSSSGNIFTVDTENRLFALAGNTGTVAWQHAFDQPVVSMLFDSGTLYVWDESGTMTALNPADGSTFWITSSDSTGGTQVNKLGMPIPVATNTVVAMVDAQGTLHGFDRASGELLWSTPGFDGTNTRLVHQGLAEADQQEWFVTLTAQGESDPDGNFELMLSGMLASTGERRWDDYLTGPLVQPVATNETMVFVVGNEAMTGKAVAPSDPVVDSESHNYYVWTGSGETAPAGGGHRLFAFDVDTGQMVWIRTTQAGGFASLSTTFPNSGALSAVTTDGLLVRPARDNGSIDGDPIQLGGPVRDVISSGETGAIGSFATLADGTLVAFGGTPFSQQG